MRHAIALIEQLRKSPDISFSQEQRKELMKEQMDKRRDAIARGQDQIGQTWDRK